MHIGIGAIYAEFLAEVRVFTVGRLGLPGFPDIPQDIAEIADYPSNSPEIPFSGANRG